MTNSQPFLLRLTPKQHKVITELADVDEVLYGGQAGPGKSDGLLMFALYRRMSCPGSVGLLVRRTFSELEKSLIRKSKTYYSPFGRYLDGKKQWIFPNGSIQEFGHCDREDDVYQYQSAEYDDIGFDELTHFTEFQYLYLSSRSRTRGEWKFLIRAATNPGNIGHNWVKERFVDYCRDKTTSYYIDDLDITMSRHFVTASLDDNTLMTDRKKRKYKAWLRGLPETQRRQLEHGDWDYVPGAAFEEISRKVHCIDIANPPDRLHEFFDFETMQPREGIKIYFGMDWGYDKPFSLQWFFTDYDGRMYLYRELYGCLGANVGIKMPAREVARAVKSSYGENKPILSIADASIWDRPGNQNERAEKLPSIADTFAEEGVFFDREISIMAKRSRLQGKHQLHERLRIKDDGLPSFFVFSSCVHWWRTVPALQVDKVDTEDVDTTQEDHSYDTTRYVLSARPIKSRIKKPEDMPFTLAWYNKKMDSRQGRE